MSGSNNHQKISYVKKKHQKTTVPEANKLVTINNHPITLEIYIIIFYIVYNSSLIIFKLFELVINQTAVIPLVHHFLLLITFLHDSIWKLLGEVHAWSLLD